MIYSHYHTGAHQPVHWFMTEGFIKPWIQPRNPQQKSQAKQTSAQQVSQSCVCAPVPRLLRSCEGVPLPCTSDTARGLQRDGSPAQRGLLCNWYPLDPLWAREQSRRTTLVASLVQGIGTPARLHRSRGTGSQTWDEETCCALVSSWLVIEKRGEDTGETRIYGRTSIFWLLTERYQL
ncbi:hypothetical protein GJAV_G00219820 [Gymnothorax javanicus]|nr:hypothetical protein GJAV_G00219820 [Gymnothorax javanicus]